MNPNDTKIVRVTNIADFDFTPEMGAMYDSRPFSLHAGESMLFPYTVGDHLATHLARQIMLQGAPTRTDKEIDGKGDTKPLWSPEREQELKQQILSDEQSEAPKVHKTDTDLMVDKVAELNGGAGKVYHDKAEVIAELQRRNIAFDARQSKATLEKLLAPIA